MTMCGLIHASILKMGRSYVTEEEEAEFIHHCRAFALRQAFSGDLKASITSLLELKVILTISWHNVFGVNSKPLPVVSGTVLTGLTDRFEVTAISWSGLDLPEKRLLCPYVRLLLWRRYKPGDRPPQPQRTFQNTWRARCEDDWLRAFYMFSFSAHPKS